MSNPTQNFPFSTKEDLIAADVSPNKTISLFLWERDESVKSPQQQESEDLQIRGVLGSGGMGEVLLAQESFPYREVAIKRPLKKERRYVRALRHEAQVMGALEHPNIIPVHRVFESDEHGFCMVMKKVQGKTLEEFRKYFGKEEWLRKGLSILIQVCNALCYAHNQGVLHRDIKPENIMLGQFGEVYLLDWGAALDLLQLQSAPKAILGTPSYMAPEMLSLNLDGIGVRTDVFLLGATLHEMLTGEKRHKGKTLKEILSSVERSDPFTFADHIPQKLAELVNSACAQDPNKRPADVLSFQQELENFLLQWEGHMLFKKAQKTLHHFAKERDPAKRLGYFFEARFGLTHVLQIIPDHDQSKRQMQKLLENMIQWQLDLGQLDFAQNLLASLQVQKTSLKESLIQKKKEKLQMQEERIHLEAVVHQHDKSQTRKERFVLVLSIAIGCISLMLAVLIYDFVYQPVITPQRLFFTMGSVFVITALTAIVKRRELLRNEIGKRIVMALCLGTFSFPLVVLATWAHLPAGQEEVQAQLVMSLDILFVALTFALVFPAIKTGLYIAISALCCFGVTLIAPEYTHAVLLIVGCISAFGLLFDWIKEQ